MENASQAAWSRKVLEFFNRFLNLSQSLSSAGASAAKTEGIVEFGAFRLDTRKRLLTRGREPVSLPPKALDVLFVLLEQPGETVTKDRLMKAVWPETFVEDGNLTQMIFLLRKALGDQAGGVPYIVTLPRQGYRFAGDVKGADQTGPPSRKKIKRHTAAAAGLVLAACAAWAIYGRGAAAPAISAIAVLPFADVTADKDMGYFCEGLASELSDTLAQIPGLRVTSRASAIEFRTRNRKIGQALSELRVQAVLDGSVRREGDHLRIAAELVNTRDGSRIWSDTYEGSAGNVFAVQGSIARSIAETLRIRMGDRPYTPRRYTSDPVTYDLYLKGRAAAGAQTSAAYFQQAIERSRNYAPAHAGLADAYLQMDAAGVLLPDAFAKARRAIDTALKLDDRLPEAHFSNANLLSREWQWNGAIAEAGRALELAPNFGPALWLKVNLLLFTGREPEARTAYAMAETLDPMGPYLPAFKLQSLLFMRRYDEIIQFAKSDPMSLHSLYYLARAYAAKGLLPEAIREFEEYRRRSTRRWQGFGVLAGVYVRSKRRTDALRILEEARELSKRTHLKPASMAQLHVGLGDFDEAFLWLEKAREQHDSTLSSLRVEPCWDPIRNDPRFAALSKKVNLID